MCAQSARARGLPTRLTRRGSRSARAFNEEMFIDELIGEYAFSTGDQNDADEELRRRILLSEGIDKKSDEERNDENEVSKVNSEIDLSSLISA